MNQLSLVVRLPGSGVVSPDRLQPLLPDWQPREGLGASSIVQLMAWSEVPQTGWRLLLVVDEEQIFHDTNQLAERYLQ